MKKTLLALFALTLCVGAFAQVIPPTLPGDPHPNQINPRPTQINPRPTPDVTTDLAKELADTKAQLAQTTQAATVEINRLSVLAERNEFAYRLTVANQQVQALSNESAQQKQLLSEAQAKYNDLQARYDMEKAKVEALLKKHPGEGVGAMQNLKTAPNIVVPPPPIDASKK